MSADSFAEQFDLIMEDCRRGAYHEAAHAVVAVALDLRVHRIDMRRTDNWQAKIWTRSSMLQWTSMLCVSMAGYFAEKRIGVPRAQRLAGAASDLEDMRKVVGGAQNPAAIRCKAHL